jgi:hypothetical protein
MDPYELLVATQKAIGDAHLYTQHQRLIQQRAEARTKVTVRGASGSEHAGPSAGCRSRHGSCGRGGDRGLL